MFKHPIRWNGVGMAEVLNEEVRVVDPSTGGAKGQKLARFDLIPPEAELALAEHYGKGEAKYPTGDDGVPNWQRGYKWSLSYAALRRHLNQWQQGESYDKESGGHHLIAVMWHAVALFTFEVRGLGTDDIRLEYVHDPLCSEGVQAGDQSMPCDCDK